MSQRNWARPGNLLDQEPVKKTGTLIRSNSEVKITEKPNNVYPFEVYVPVELEEPGENKNPKHKYKMSTVVNYFLHSAAKMGISLAPLGNTTDLPMTMEDREFTKTQGSIENSNNPSSPMLGKQSSMSLLSKKFASSTKIPKSPVRSNAFSKYNLK